MSKAIFVIDEIPDNCYDCPLRVYVDCYIKYVCQDILNFDFEETETDVFEIFCKCPLKPIPYKYGIDEDERADTYEDGWNDCIDEMLKENDDGTEKK